MVHTKKGSHTIINLDHVITVNMNYGQEDFGIKPYIEFLLINGKDTRWSYDTLELMKEEFDSLISMTNCVSKTKMRNI